MDHTIRVGLDIGGLLAPAAQAKQAIHSLEEEITKAGKAGDFSKVASLGYKKDQMQGRVQAYEKNVHSMADNPKNYMRTEDGRTVFKLAPESERKMQSLVDAFNRRIPQFVEAIQKGDFAGMQHHSEHLDSFFNDFKNMAKKNVLDDGSGGGGLLKTAGKAIGWERAFNAIGGVIDSIAEYNRAGVNVIAKKGRGDIVGANIADKQRDYNVAGTAITAGAALTGMGIGAAIGSGVPVVGTLIGAGVGLVVGKVAEMIMSNDISEKEKKATLAGFWEQHATPAMELSATFNKDTSSRGIRNIWRESADIGARHGYLSGDAMDLMKQAAVQGNNYERAKKLTNTVLRFERGTGADRNTLASIAFMSERYGAGNALGYGLAGVEKSGMKQGQLPEFYRAMQKITEDGIRKGFVLSSKDVASSLTMIARVGGTTWQGENGVRVLSQMNAGMESAKNPDSGTKMIAYQTMKNILAAKGEDTSHTSVKLALEQGRYRAELYRDFANNAKAIYGYHDAVSGIEETMGMSTTDTVKLINNSQKFTDPMLDPKNPIAPQSREYHRAKDTAKVIEQHVVAGQVAYDLQEKEIKEEYGKSLKLLKSYDKMQNTIDDLLGGSENSHESGSPAPPPPLLSSNQLPPPYAGADADKSLSVKNSTIPNGMTDTTGQQISAKMDKLIDLWDHINVTVNG
jgi:hypothetical protein